MTVIPYFPHAEDVTSYPAGTVVFSQGEKGDVMYALVEGEIDIVIKGRTVATLGPGNLVGEMALIDQAERSATVIARTECQMVAIDDRRFSFLVQQNPFFALDLMRIFAERLRNMNQLLT